MWYAIWQFDLWFQYQQTLSFTFCVNFSGDNISHTYTSIALDTRLFAQPYQPIQVELSSPAIQNSCRGLIWGPIFSCPALPRSWSCPGEKNSEYLQTNCKNKDLFLHILPYSNQNRIATPLQILKYPFFTPSISIQNGVSVKLSNVMTSQQCQRGTKRLREQNDQRNDQSRPLCVLRVIKSLSLESVN